MPTPKQRQNSERKSGGSRPSQTVVAHGQAATRRFTVLGQSKSLPRLVNSNNRPSRRAHFLARLIAAANLAERGEIPVTSTVGLSDDEFASLIRASAQGD